MSQNASLADLQGPAGNTYDKYGTRNPLTRLVVGWFLSAAEAAVAESEAASILGLSGSAVKVRLFRARMKMSDLLVRRLRSYFAPGKGGPSCGRS